MTETTNTVTIKQPPEARNLSCMVIRGDLYFATDGEYIVPEELADEAQSRIQAHVYRVTGETPAAPTEEVETDDDA